MSDRKGYRNGRLIYPVSVVNTKDDSSTTPQAADYERLERTVRELNNWKEGLEETSENGQIDTLQEAYDALNDMQVEDISSDEIDSWFPNNEQND